MSSGSRPEDLAETERIENLKGQQQRVAWREQQMHVISESNQLIADIYLGLSAALCREFVKMLRDGGS